MPRVDAERQRRRLAGTAENVSMQAYSPKHHVLQSTITAPCSFPGAQQDRRTLYFRGGPAELLNAQQASYMLSQQVAHKGNFQTTQWQQKVLQEMQPEVGQYHTRGRPRRAWQAAKPGGNDRQSTDDLQRLV